MAVLGASLVSPAGFGFPNGGVTAYYDLGAAVGRCVAYSMDKADYNTALKNPDGALWSLSPQRATILNRTYGVAGQRPVASNLGGPAVFFPTGSSVDAGGTYSNLAGGTITCDVLSDQAAPAEGAATMGAAS